MQRLERRDGAPPPSRKRPGASTGADVERPGGVNPQNTAKPPKDQAFVGAPERLTVALAATLHGLQEVRRSPAPGTLSAALAAIWRNRLGDGERAFLAATGAQSLDPEAVLDLGDAILDEFGMAPGMEIERRRLEMVASWKRGA